MHIRRTAHRVASPERWERTAVPSCGTWPSSHRPRCPRRIACAEFTTVPAPHYPRNGCIDPASDTRTVCLAPRVISARIAARRGARRRRRIRSRPHKRATPARAPSAGTPGEYGALAQNESSPHRQRPRRFSASDRPIRPWPHGPPADLTYSTTIHYKPCMVIHDTNV